MHPIVLAITGASGAAYGVRLLRVLLSAGREVHMTISPAAVRVAELELGLSIDLDRFDAVQLLGAETSGTLVYHHQNDYAAPIASGSFRTAGMVICPCSMGTASAIANGTSRSLIERSADVTLKERRKLILVPRETPLSLIHLRNLTQVTEAGAVVIPAAPGFYHRPTRISELVDFIVQRVLDQLGLEIEIGKRWGEG